MNKKIMALAVASALAAPAVVLAQASNVQIFGTMYMEYAAAHQGQAGAVSLPTTFANNGGSSTSNFSAKVAAGDLQNVDILQSPGSEVGIKGEQALGGGNSVWFQCASTADIRGGGVSGFCGRNSAIGLKSSMGNVYVGNWDMPMKKTAGAVRIVSDTAIWGAGPMLFGNSASYDGAAGGTERVEGACRCLDQITDAADVDHRMACAAGVQPSGEFCDHSPCVARGE